MAIDVVDLLAFFTSLLNHGSNSCFAKFDDYNCIEKFLGTFFTKFFRTQSSSKSYNVETK